MKAITLWQPWASAMWKGFKKNETRSWETNVRGDVAICSAKKKVSREEMNDDAAYKFAMGEPFGFVLCIVELFDCVPTSEFTGLFPKYTLSTAEKELGDYSPFRFVWLTRNLRPLKTPIPVIGRQGWFNLPEITTLQIHEALTRATELLKKKD